MDSFIYAGHSDAPHSKWKFISNTDEAKQQAIAEGFTAFSTLSFSHEPKENTAEPIRKGDLVLDFDSKTNPALAIIEATDLAQTLLIHFGVHVDDLKYYLSGNKGCHLVVPAKIFSGECGSPFLPLHHKRLLYFIAEKCGSLKYLDTSLYCMGKGKLLRHENIKRPNGRYKVSVTYDELVSLSYEELEKLTFAPRQINFETKEITPSELLTSQFDLCLSIERLAQNPTDILNIFDSISKCKFLTNCYHNQTTLSEPAWWAMIKVLLNFKKFSTELIHEFSRKHPEYTFEETEQKINQARNNHSILTCQYLKSLYACQSDCGVRSPVDLWQRNQVQNIINSQRFILKPDGVYLKTDIDENKYIFVCTYLKVLGKMRDCENKGWARLVEIKTPDGLIKQIPIYMRDFAGKSEAIRALLLDSGLEFSATISKPTALLMDYLEINSNNEDLILSISKTGWNKDIYILPDEQFGQTDGEKVYFTESVDNLHNSKGSLEEWQQNIGMYAQGNSLISLCMSFALTAPFLKLCNIEGGGLNIYGASSAGKTTLALIAGSVCGGGGNNGFLRSWRSTHNALEHTAVLHNDNLLVLDELGQATGDTVSQVSYMLMQGQGKDRLRSDITRRNALKWRLNLLSTGELTINDKIEDNGKMRAMVGQEIRIIDLPIDADDGQNLFENLHGFIDSASLSTFLAKNSTLYYGTALREFLRKICNENLNDHVQTINTEIENFVKTQCQADVSGQVVRVATKFGLISAVGELAIRFGILPLNPNEVRLATEKWFAIWLNKRGTTDDVEIERGVKKVQDFITLFGNDKFSELNGHHIFNSVGYKWEEAKQAYYFILTPALNEILRGFNKKQVIEKMLSRDWVLKNNKGKLCDTKFVRGRNYRGIIFMPQKWEGLVEPELKNITIDNKNDLENIF